MSVQASATRLDSAIAAGSGAAPAAAKPATAGPAAKASKFTWKTYVPHAMTSLVVVTLGLGYAFRASPVIAADTGLGYQLGIIGSVMMTLPLLFALRKRVSWLEWMGKIPDWFRLHMLVGIVGPTLIVLHSDFRVSAINSAMAVLAMAIVFCTGLFGRYLAAKLNKRLTSGKAARETMTRSLKAMRAKIGDDVANPALLARLDKLEAFAKKPPATLRGSLQAVVAKGISQVRHRQMLLAGLDDVTLAKARAENWPARQLADERAAVAELVNACHAATGTAARFTVLERLVGFWRQLHMPLFFLLVLTAIIHIIAVHLY